jgi:probable rRNA maturation factor
MTAMIDIVVADRRWRALGGVVARCRAAARAALAAGARDARAAELAIRLTDDAELRRLNRAFRGIDKPTNVLSFPATDSPEPVGALGDVALAFETVAAEAARQGKAPADHLSHLVVHGVLHLLGFDHARRAEARTMEGLEVAALAGLGIADPYGVRA